MNEADGSMRRNLLVAGLVALVMAGFVLLYTALRPTEVQPGMGGMEGMAAGGAAIPPVIGYSEGEEISFLHPEASDPEVAAVLTEMMGSPVLVVPSLAHTPESARAKVYVFENGIEGNGPFGFQPDVFDHPPGSEGYTPLREVHLVTWRDESDARELRSAAEVQEASTQGELEIEPTGIVVNMPVVTWPGGQR